MHKAYLSILSQVEIGSAQQAVVCCSSFKGAMAPLVPKGTSFVIINAEGLNFPVLDTCTTQINARLTGIKKALCCAQSLSINIVPSRNWLCSASRALLFLIKGALAPLVPKGTSFVIINAEGLNFSVLDTGAIPINARLTGIKKALC